MTLKTEPTDDGVFRAYDPDVPWIEGYGTTRDEAKAEARAVAAEAEKRKPRNTEAPTERSVCENDEQIPPKLAKRRRKVKAPDWVLEWVKDGWEPDGKEDGWRLGDPEGYEKAADTIAKIKAASPALKVEYGFRDKYPIEVYGFDKPFDLADSLIGLLYTYIRKKAQPPMKERIKEEDKEGKRRLAEIRKTGTLANVRSEEIVALSLAGYTSLHRDPVTRREKHALARAARKAWHQAMQAPKKEGGAGRYLTAEAILARGLVTTYYRGTGNLPLTGSRSQFRGPYADFAHECLALLNIAVKDSMLRDQAQRKVKRKKNGAMRARNGGVKSKP